MKLSLRIAGLCGSSVFLITAMPGFYQRVRPTDFAQMSSETLSGMSIVETMLISVAGSIAAAIIGYIIGDILSNPQGKPKSHKHKKDPAFKEPPAPSVALDMNAAAAQSMNLEVEEPAEGLMGSIPAEAGLEDAKPEEA